MYDYFCSEYKISFNGLLCYDSCLNMLSMILEELYWDESFLFNFCSIFDKFMLFIFVKHRNCKYINIYSSEIKNIFVIFQKFCELVKNDMKRYEIKILPCFRDLYFFIMNKSIMNSSIIESDVYYNLISLYFEIIIMTKIKLNLKLMVQFLQICRRFMSEPNNELELNSKFDQILADNFFIDFESENGQLLNNKIFNIFTKKLKEIQKMLSTNESLSENFKNYLKDFFNSFNVLLSTLDLKDKQMKFYKKQKIEDLNKIIKSISFKIITDYFDAFISYSKFETSFNNLHKKWKRIEFFTSFRNKIKD
ncbi:hypothetical protein HZS_5047 [Henneguya salminicola]|nr:hypothetical protein HZS_5047 [Henneguya salminicola]